MNTLQATLKIQNAWRNYYFFKNYCYQECYRCEKPENFGGSSVNLVYKKLPKLRSQIVTGDAVKDLPLKNLLITVMIISVKEIVEF